MTPEERRAHTLGTVSMALSAEYNRGRAEAILARPDERPVHVITEEHRRIEREAAAAQSLDVERLYRAALEHIDGDGLIDVTDLPAIAAEYALLSLKEGPR